MRGGGQKGKGSSAVIASEAKQSSDRGGYWIASSPRPSQ